MAVATRLRARRPGAAVLRVGKPRDSPILPDFDDVVVFHTGDRPPAMVEPQRIKVGCDVDILAVDEAPNEADVIAPRRASRNASCWATSHPAPFCAAAR
jgi:hypothetical protein